LSIATYAVATSVSILPASLVAVVSLTLANASRELAKRKALVRRMDAVESLAAVDDVCSDKASNLYLYAVVRRSDSFDQTGTITVGKMVLKKAWVPSTDADPREGKGKAPVDTRFGQMYAVESGSDPFFPRGMVNSLPRNVLNTKTVKLESPEDYDSQRGSEESPQEEDDAIFHSETVVYPNMMEARLRELVLCGSLCNTASIHYSKDKNAWEANGDPTEIALQVRHYTADPV
jgi:magnesium-transporting ATPase (P-type)